MSYIYIEVGSHTWEIERTVTDGRVVSTEIEDGVEVLAGLKFGWSMTGPLWPSQPAPMTASLAINAPAFSDVADVAEGDPVVIEIRAAEEEPIWASFYGRVTDPQANPRPGKVRRGVTLSVVAVDYTVDTAETTRQELDVDASDDNYKVVNACFDLVCGGLLAPSGVPTQWTSPTATINTPGDLNNPRSVIDAVLLESVDLDDNTRMILAPMIESDGHLAISGRRFTLDTVERVTDLTDSDATITADNLFKDVSWYQAKGEDPTQVKVICEDGKTATATQAGATEPYTVYTINSRNEDATPTYIADVAEFYLPPESDPWRLRDVVWNLTPLGEVPNIQFALFPDLKAAEGAPERVACYQLRVKLDDLHETWLPFTPAASVIGILRGVTVTVNRDRMLVNLALRPTSHEAPGI